MVALLNLSSWCLVMVERLFLAVPRDCMQFVIVVFPDHTHLRSGLKAPAEPSRAELPTRRVKFLFSKTSSEEINHKYFLYKIIT